MARQARFVLPGQPHLVSQRGHNGSAIVYDAADAQQWVRLLREVVATHHLPLHGWSLGESEFRLLVTPRTETGLARLVQDLGRRYVGAFNQRHGRSGTLWDGRFRSAAVVGGGPLEIDALVYAEGLDTSGALGSAGHHLGMVADPLIVDAPAYWALGNTPFERHAAWQQKRQAGLSPRSSNLIEAALLSGRPLAERAVIAHLQRTTARPLLARPRGRPRRASSP